MTGEPTRIARNMFLAVLSRLARSTAHLVSKSGSSGLWRHICKASSLSSAVISNALRKTRTQLGPGSSLDYRAGFTLSRFYTPS